MMTRMNVARELIKVAKDLSAEVTQYETMNDAAEVQDLPGLAAGSVEVWYSKNTYPNPFTMGMSFWEEENGKSLTHTLLKNPKKTHVLMGKIKESKPEKIFALLQGERWSPNGEARTLVKKSGSGHTSMMTGDFVKIGNRIAFVDRYGFTLLVPGS